MTYSQPTTQSLFNRQNKNSLTYLMALCATLFMVTVSSGFMVDEITYDELSAPKITFKNLNESSSTDPFELVDGEMVGHYGTPTLNGNTIAFNTPSFAAQVFPGPYMDLTDGFLSLSMVAEPGQFVESVHLEEFGSMSLTSPLGGSHTTLVNVETPVFITVNEVLLDDGTANGMLYTLPNAVTVSGLMGVYPDRNSPPGWDSLDDPNNTIWSGELMIDIPQALADGGLNGITVGDGDNASELPIMGFTRAEYKMNNILTALAADDVSAAFIDKKGIYINPFPQETPEPGGGMLLFQALLVGLPLTKVLRKRKK